MASPATSGSLPMLFADLADEASRDFLQGVALAEGVTEVPLLAAPIDRTTHVLEVYSPESSEPLRLYADPVGPPTSEGFPLRLRFTHEESKPQLKAEKKSDRSNDRPPTMRARHVTSHDLTERHTADLEGAPKAEKRPSEVIGRELANGKLRIESLIGGGGVGAVYKAQHRDLRIPVAVKVLHDNFQADADFGRRFHAEALAASRLDHPNITRVLDFGQEPDGLLYLVMEYLDGTGLRSILEREKRLSLERIVKLTSQVCAGLAHAHARKIVHKDIKPENLVIIPGHDDDGNAMEVVKVCDFGIAQGAVHEETRRFQGTPEYMSPEQCTSSELDARSDLYSLGIVMYELATGDVPFIEEDLRHLLWLQINEPPTPPSKRFPGVDPRLERIILRSIAKDRDQRWASMRDLRSQLRDLLDKPVTALSGRYPRGPSLDEAAKIMAARQAAKAQAQQSPPPPPSSGNGNDWIQRGGEVMLELASGPNISPRSELTADPAAFMRKLVSTTDARQFAELVAPLEPAIPELAQGQQIEALWRLASTLDILATEGPELPGSRAAMSKAILRVLHDPGNLAPVAQRVLTVGVVAGERLLTSAGAFGAHALYSVRVRLSNEQEIRQRFVKALRAIGAASMPVLRGGLERLGDRLGTPNATFVAEELLTAMPPFHDEQTGAVVASYARSNNPTLVRAAATALPLVWRERARPLILGLIDHDHDDVVVAALGAMAHLGVNDTHTPRHIATVLDRRRSRAIAHAALRTLSQARGDAKGAAAKLVEERLRKMTELATIDDVELALGLIRTTAVLVDKGYADKLVDDVSKAWPADVKQRAKAS